MLADALSLRPSLPRPSDVHCHAAGWDIIGKPGAYQLRDTDTFNPWHDHSMVATLDEAVTLAWCHWHAKRGR